MHVHENARQISTFVAPSLATALELPALILKFVPISRAWDFLGVGVAITGVAEAVENWGSRSSS